MQLLRKDNHNMSWKLVRNTVFSAGSIFSYVTHTLTHCGKPATDLYRCSVCGLKAGKAAKDLHRKIS